MTRKQMSLTQRKIVYTVWRMLPLSLRRKLRTEAGVRFTRFVPAAVAAVITSQVLLALLNGPFGVSAGISAIAASIVAAGVSYLMSRWAWERKGRPDLLRETLPFWAVSIGVWLLLGLTTHFASVWAHSMGLHHWRRVLVVNGAYFVANCVTFVTRFVIFHYLLFNDRRGKARHARHAGPATGEATAGGATGAGGGAADSEQEALAFVPAPTAPVRGPADRGQPG
jgi:putative flippase GtrA